MNVNEVLSDLATSLILLKPSKEEWKYVIMDYGKVFVIAIMDFGEEGKQDLCVSNYWDMHLKVNIGVCKVKLQNNFSF